MQAWGVMFQVNLSFTHTQESSSSCCKSELKLLTPEAWRKRNKNACHPPSGAALFDDYFQYQANNLEVNRKQGGERGVQNTYKVPGWNRKPGQFMLFVS